MSFAYKLWKVGSVLTQDDIIPIFRDNEDIKGDDAPAYLAIDFTIENGSIKKIVLKETSIPKDKMFFTEMIGGMGSGIYYLYPNLKLQNDSLEKKSLQLLNTLEKSVHKHASTANRVITQIIIDKITPIKYYFEIENLELALQNEVKENKKLKNKLETVKAKIEIWDENLRALSIEIQKKPKGNYWFWLSINGETFYELMPEVWDNWFENPVIKNDDTKHGYDAFTNKETEVGYRPEIKVFSYDNYHDSLNYRINENLPLSLESARNIKFAWMYIRKNLLFKYKNLEYVILPNLLEDNPLILRKILERFRRVKGNTTHKNNVLYSLRKHEKKLLNDIEKLRKKNRGDGQQELQEVEQERKDVMKELSKADLGIITEFNDELKEISNFNHAITVDYIFTNLNLTNLSFEIKGSIEDVIPSHISNVVSLMEENQLTDLVTLTNKDENKTYLQDFFNRKELYFILTRSVKNNANSILKERLYLAKLLLTDAKIHRDDLLDRFMKNREYWYDQKKRILNDGTKEWISFPDTFITNENSVINFLATLDKIKD